VLQPGLSSVTLFTMSGNILFDGEFIRTGIYTMKSGKGTVEVHFSGNDSFDLNAQTATGTVDNQAEALLRPDSHGVRHIASRFTKGLFGTVRQRTRESRTLLLQWYNPHSEARLARRSGFSLFRLNDATSFATSPIGSAGALLGRVHGLRQDYRGHLLARQLAWRFVDLDERIEQSAGLRIPEIFERLGEGTFRQMEADQLRAALGRAAEHKESVVLALGGGTYAQTGAPEFLRAAGVPVIWLDAGPDILLSAA